MIWRGLGQSIRVELFFPGQPADEFFFLANRLMSFFFFQVVELGFFPGRVAVEFISPPLPEPPLIINGSSLKAKFLITKITIVS